MLSACFLVTANFGKSFPLLEGREFLAVMFMNSLEIQS